MTRPSACGSAAIGLVVLDVVVRLLAGEAYPSATALLVGACGLALVTFAPAQLSDPVVRLALVPALGLGSFAFLLTSVATAGIALTESSIRVAVACFVAVLVLLDARLGDGRAARPGKRDLATGAALLAVCALAFASAWEVVEPFPPPGSDWAYYLVYAEEVRDQEALLVESPYAVEQPEAFGNYPGLGALLGSALVLDGVSSRRLLEVIALVSALSTLSVFVAAAGLWGAAAGLLAALAYAVAAIRLEPMYWHGLGTVLGLVFVPLVVLGLGLLYRRARDARTVLLLGFALGGVAVAHAASVPVVAIAIGIVLVADALQVLVQRSARGWWRDGLWRPVLAGVALACVLALGAIVHLRRLAAELGSPVSYRFFDAEWFGLDALEFYFGWAFLALVAASVVAVAASPRLRSDPALAALAALAGAALLASQLWRLEIAFEYRRVVYYAAISMVMFVGAASLAVTGRRPLAWAGALLALAYVAHGSIGLRLPERLLERETVPSVAADAMTGLRDELDAARREDVVLVADRCLGIRVAYFVRRPTIVAAEPWQAGFSELVRAASLGQAVIRGGPEGRRVAARLGADFVLVDPRCTPEPAPGLGARVVHSSDELRIVALDS